MRKLNKFKKYTKVSLVTRHPRRILKFKRPKWGLLKIRILKKEAQARKKLKNLSKTYPYTAHLKTKSIASTYVSIQKWDKLKQNYKNRLLSYSYLNILFDQTLKLKAIKSNKDVKVRRNMLLKQFFTNYYKLSTLLWFNNFVESPYKGKQKIHSKSLVVNNTPIYSDLTLSLGDIVTMVDSKLNVKSIEERYFPTISMLTHIETDIYSQNFVVIKDLLELSNEDFYFLLTDYINIQDLR